jgi:hypothetical protein
VRFRGVQAYPQAIAGQVAVCGQAAVFGAASGTYVMFVSVVSKTAEADGAGHGFRVDGVHIGSTMQEATKTYIETINRCYEGGGPSPGLRAAPPLPPLPDNPQALVEGSGPRSSQDRPPDRPAAAAAAPTPLAPQPPPQAAPAPLGQALLGTVTMRQNGNIHIEPHGETVRVEHQGAILHVFAEAPGGWLQVGDTQPFGWVHSSLVDRN